MIAPFARALRVLQQPNWEGKIPDYVIASTLDALEGHLEELAENGASLIDVRDARCELVDLMAFAPDAHHLRIESLMRDYEALLT